MPTYEYRCPEGHESEDFVLKISDAKPEIPCSTCGAVASRRMSAGSGLLFKGSGFYITDYGKDGKKDLREKQQKAAASTAASTGTAGSGTTAAPSAPSPAAATVKPSGSTSSSSGSSGTSSAS